MRITGCARGLKAYMFMPNIRYTAVTVLPNKDTNPQISLQRSSTKHNSYTFQHISANSNSRLKRLALALHSHQLGLRQLGHHTFQHMLSLLKCPLCNGCIIDLLGVYRAALASGKLHVEGGLMRQVRAVLEGREMCSVRFIPSWFVEK